MAAKKWANCQVRSDWRSCVLWGILKVQSAQSGQNAGIVAAAWHLKSASASQWIAVFGRSEWALIHFTARSGRPHERVFQNFTSRLALITLQ
jgi:hypothetical protein